MILSYIDTLSLINNRNNCDGMAMQEVWWKSNSSKSVAKQYHSTDTIANTRSLIREGMQTFFEQNSLRTIITNC